MQQTTALGFQTSSYRGNYGLASESGDVVACTFSVDNVIVQSKSYRILMIVDRSESMERTMPIVKASIDYVFTEMVKSPSVG